MMKKNTVTRRISVFLPVLALLLVFCVPTAFAEEASLFRAAVLYDITTMDVAQTTDDYLIPLNVFDRLFETRLVDGAAKVLNSLCTEFSISEDGRTYNFTLRSDVVFSNGSALTASDVQYSFERLLIAANQNTDIPLEVVGGEALMNGGAEALDGFQVTDDTHFSVTLNTPNAGFIAELSSPAMSIVDAETMAEVEHFGMEPGDTIGTGPYLVTEWLSNDHYTLEYNPLYWGEEPSVKKLVVRIIPDANTQNLMFQNGELDLIDLKSLDNSIVEATYKRLYLNQIVSTPEVGLTYFIMNENNRFLQDVNVRKAIGMAIDVDTIISTIYNGNALREHGVIPTGIWGHNDDLESFSYNPDAARALLQEAGYRDGDISFEISLDSAADGSLQLVNHFISQQLKAIGINASVKSYDHSSWLSLRLSGEMDSFVAHWGMDYNDPSNIMYAFFGNAQNSASRSINYSNKNIMARVAAAASIVDEDAREAEYQALEKQLICEDAVWVPMYSELHLYCFGSKVQSFTPQWAGFSDFYASDVLLK